MLLSTQFNSLLKVFRGRNLSCFQHFNLSSYAIQYKEYGDPSSVLEKVEIQLPDNPTKNEVLFKVLASPVNPADINMIQGKYALKPKLPAIGGNECVAEVIKIGPEVKRLKIGSRVIPAHAGTGTWRTHNVCTEDHLIEVDKELALCCASTISVNPCTAYRMLKDFVPLEEGSSVIQNGANSAVGQAVIQIARHFKVHTINVVRDRPDLASLKSYLRDLGATHVVTENELRSPVMSDIYKSIPMPRLGFNCVGGRSAAELLRNMAGRPTLVTYGGMSKQPLAIGTASLIFGDATLRGFWMTRWSQEHSTGERAAMLSDITALIRSGGLKPAAFTEVDFDNFKEAVAKSMEPFGSNKQILMMR